VAWVIATADILPAGAKLYKVISVPDGVILKIVPVPLAPPAGVTP
jgi:hypothetical protein